MLDPNYTRVFPRDLFNEGNLLKCLGQLALFIHDGVVKNVRMELREDAGFAFQVAQDDADGSLLVANLCVWRQVAGRRQELSLYRPLNSRQPWPLYALPDGGHDAFPVFTESGRLSDEFLAYDLAGAE